MFKIGDKVNRKEEWQGSLFWSTYCDQRDFSTDGIFTVSDIDGENIYLAEMPTDCLFCFNKFKLFVEEETKFTSDDEKLLQELLQKKAKHEADIAYRKAVIKELESFLTYGIGKYTMEELETLRDNINAYLKITRKEPK